MADHKVPQDVEADDKLIGPFGFRQFVYLMIAGGLCLLAVWLFQIFFLLAIIPVPFALFFLVLALPLRKEQPTETYLVALFNFYFKSHNRWWVPGQRETTITIDAPKRQEEPFHNVNREEVSNRLSFLANVVDTEGEAVNSSMDANFFANASATQDIFEQADRSGNLDSMLVKEDLARTETINQIMNTGESQSQSPAPPPPPTPTSTGTKDLSTAEILTGGRSISSGNL